MKPTGLMGRKILKTCLISWRHKDENGYSRLAKDVWGHNYEHRYVYSKTHNNYIFKPGEEVMHTCDTPGCIEETHLILGSHSDNMLDCYTKGRRTNKGINNPNSKLTEEEIEKIQDLYHYDNVSRLYLTKEFNCSLSTIDRILNGTT
jgi:hypothetical protein